MTLQRVYILYTSSLVFFWNMYGDCRVEFIFRTMSFFSQPNIYTQSAAVFTMIPSSAMELLKYQDNIFPPHQTWQKHDNIHNCFKFSPGNGLKMNFWESAFFQITIHCNSKWLIWLRNIIKKKELAWCNSKY